jgi:hypothetical protein
VIVSAATAHAAGGAYEHCNQILQQDIHKRVVSDTTSKSVSASLQVRSFFSMSDSEAYSQYSRDYAEAQQKGSQVGMEAHYAFIGGGFSSAVSSGKKLSESEFSQLRSRARAEWSQSEQSQHSQAEELVTHYSTEGGDPEIVAAWTKCISKSEQVGIYAYASPDSAGKVRVNVMWVPGPFVSFAPSIPVTFVTDDGDEGVQVVAKPEEIIANGSGRSFAVKCGKVCNKGFQIGVNATLVDEHGKVVNSFTDSVDIPGPNPDAVLQDVLAAKGPTIASQDPLSVELRNQQLDGPCRRAFDIGMAAAEGQTLPGPGKTKLGSSLSVAVQSCYWAAIEFSLARNRGREFAANGAAIAQRDPVVAAARKAIPTVFHALGFDIATGIFASQASGGAGHTLEGPGSSALRDGMNPDGQAGFRAAVKLFLGQKHQAPAAR